MAGQPTGRIAVLTAAVAGSLAACAGSSGNGPVEHPRRASRSGGLSPAGLDRMAEVMRGHVERGEVAGVVTLLSRHDEVHVEAMGAMDLVSAAPMRRDTLFRIASMTKPITAVAAMILVEEGKLGLDDPVDRWLPELANRKVLRHLESALDDTVPAQRPITVRDLLTFRAGLGAVMAPPGTYPIQTAMAEARVAPGYDPIPFPPDEFMRRLARLPLIHQPGERWLYHTGSEILGVLIARASGMRLEDFLSQRIFAPLGMKDTAFSVPQAKLDRLATCYRIDDRTGRLVVWDDPRAGLWSRPPVFPAGGGQGGGLVSTADDYLAFGRLMLDLGRHRQGRLLSRRSVEAMTSDQLTPEQKALSPFYPGFWDHRGWGFGVSVVTRPDGVAAFPGRYGWTGGAGTTFFVDPHEDLVAILLIQRLMKSPVPDAIAVDFAKLAYQAIER
jgi:CubicO group peptidase (beta-lactamase class C family)